MYVTCMYTYMYVVCMYVCYMYNMCVARVIYYIHTLYMYVCMQLYVCTVYSVMIHDMRRRI